METSLLRDTAALLPSTRARLLGSGRLPLAALPGHDAVVLAGRTVGTGRGGVLAVALKAPAGRLVTACATSGSGPEAMPDDEDVLLPMDFTALKDLDGMYEKLEKLSGMALLTPPPPLPLSKEEMASQAKLKEIAERCLILLADSMACLRPAQLRPLYSMVLIIHLTFGRVAAAAKNGRANSNMVVVVAETLDLVRKLVSSVCTTNLPLQGPKDVTYRCVVGTPQSQRRHRDVSLRISPCAPVEQQQTPGKNVTYRFPVFGRERDAASNFEMAWVALLESLYNTVMEDIDELISATT